MSAGHHPAMTEDWIKRHPAYTGALLERLQGLGFDGDAAQALALIDAELFSWSRQMQRMDMPRQILDQLGLRIDMAQFQALTAVTRIECGSLPSGPQPVTVGALAEELLIDPSRASRLASSLIDAGYLRRAADQADGRRSVLALTPKAGRVFSAFTQAKWGRYAALFDGWDTADITRFAELLSRFRQANRAVSAAQDGPNTE